MVIQERALSRTAVFVVLAFAASGVIAQQLFKCGATFQDRPCPSEDVQKRFSHTSGGFSINQVNADTDKECAVAAADALPFWQRMNSGESLEKIKAEIDAKPISRYEKSQMRDALIAIKQFRGSVKEVRSQFESQCMNYKRAHGMPTEREVASGDRSTRSDTAEMRARVAQERAAEGRERQARAEDERLARVDELRARNTARAAAAAAAAAARPRPDTRADTRPR